MLKSVILVMSVLLFFGCSESDVVSALQNSGDISSGDECNGAFKVASLYCNEEDGVSAVGSSVGSTLSSAVIEESSGVVISEPGTGESSDIAVSGPGMDESSDIAVSEPGMVESSVLELSSAQRISSQDISSQSVDESSAVVVPISSADGESSEATLSSVEIVDVGKPNFLHREGVALFDSRGVKVRLTGVNWFGFETNNKIIHGLWARDYKETLKHIVDLGFNSIRMPWSNAIIGSTEIVEVNAFEMNAELVGKNSLEAMDIIIEEARVLGLKIILDNHSRAVDAYLEEDLWYTDSFSEDEWVADWVFMAERYKGNDAVIGFDLNNEPNGRANWGGNDAFDWKKAAERCGEAILAVNPDVLILVEGVEGVDGKANSDADHLYWWGGNLQGVKDKPIELSKPEKLVYSPHEYGPTVFLQPWFQDPSFPNNMEGIWNSRFGYIYEDEIGHLLIGELGIKTDGGQDEEWFSTFLEYMGDRLDGYSWTFWAWNPNSGDTGGIVGYDWKTVVQWKVDYLKPYMAPMIGNGNGI